MLQPQFDHADVKQVFWTLATLLVALAGPPFVAIAGRLPRGSPSAITSLPFDLALWAMLAVVLIVVLAVERQPLASIGLRPPRWSTIFWALLLFFSFSFVLGPAMTWSIDKLGLPGYRQGLAQFRILPAWYRVFLAISAGIIEEPLYRGYAVERLSLLSRSYWIGGLLAAAAFGLAHLPTWGIGPAVVSLATGAVSTAFYVWKRDLVALIIAHSMGDVFGLVVLPAVS